SGSFSRELKSHGMPTDREERLKEELKESATISPKTGKGNKVHFSLLRSAMLTFKGLSLILSDAAKCDFGERNDLTRWQTAKRHFD
ncbi:MAG TPA: hypothetical protein VMW91_01155, partial [Desulfosporosinus sp.]|nr:hypothetical protein [Desulfosporosinus sp.]